MTWEAKDPEAVLDYSMDWGPWLEEGDAIESAVWTVPAGLTKESQSETASEDGGPIDTTTVWLSGGTAGERYEVKCHIVTSGGREDERTAVLRCKQR